jgi:ATP diphosphatase
VFHARIAAETGRFDIVSVVDGITAKLVRRHPHVFTPDGRRLSRTAKRRKSSASVTTPRAVIEQWAAIKAREQVAEGRPRRVLAGVPQALPALLGSHKIGSRVAAVGFDWPRATDVVAKIEEEVRELRDAVEQGLTQSATEEMGDLLFSIANLSRKLGVEPESALRAANQKFIGRFDLVEKHLERRGRSVHEATLEELEEAWNRVKK